MLSMMRSVSSGGMVLANLVLHLAEDHLCVVFDAPVPGPGADVQFDLPRVDGGKEVPAHERQQKESSRHESDVR